MRDDLAAPILGTATETYDKTFFHTFFRALEQFHAKLLSPGPIRVDSITSGDGSGGPDSSFVSKTGDTMSGNLVIENTGGTSTLVLRRTGSGSGAVDFQSGTSMRWRINGSGNGADGASNAGADFHINRYDNVGVLIAQALFISRNTGEVTVNTGIRIPNNLTVNLASTDHAFQLGVTTSLNLRLNQNQIQAVNNGVASGLYLNYNGGGVYIGTNVAANTFGLTVNGPVTPNVTGVSDLGSTAARWNTVYTSDLDLNNGIGDWTIVEGEDDLFLYNNKRRKVYKFALTEVDPSEAPPKREA